MSKAISRRDFIKVTGAVGAAGLLAACGGNSGAASSTAPASSAAAASVEAVGGLSSDPVTLTMSWWGGESRHNAYQDGILLDMSIIWNGKKKRLPESHWQPG